MKMNVCCVIIIIPMGYNIITPLWYNERTQTARDWRQGVNSMALVASEPIRRKVDVAVISLKASMAVVVVDVETIHFSTHECVGSMSTKAIHLFSGTFRSAPTTCKPTTAYFVLVCSHWIKCLERKQLKRRWVGRVEYIVRLSRLSLDPIKFQSTSQISFLSL